LHKYLEGYVTLLPDERTCEIWSEVNSECWASGRPISPADAWIAATAKQWDLALATANYRDFQAVPGLNVIALQ